MQGEGKKVSCITSSFPQEGNVYTTFSQEVITFISFLISRSEMKAWSVSMWVIFFPLELSFQVWHFSQVLMGRSSFQVFICSVAMGFVYCITQCPFEMACKELEVKTPWFPSSHKVQQRDYWKGWLLLKLEVCLFCSIWPVSNNVTCTQLDFHIRSVRACLLPFSEHAPFLLRWNFLSVRDGF